MKLNTTVNSATSLISCPDYHVKNFGLLDTSICNHTKNLDYISNLYNLSIGRKKKITSEENRVHHPQKKNESITSCMTLFQDFLEQARQMQQDGFSQSSDANQYNSPTLSNMATEV